tara:strand:+ start:4886 stop:5419 length:534 start_codon:yes stop_codon:yes gene_type:complete
MKKIAIILLVLIGAFALYRIYDIGYYFKSRLKWEKKYKEIEANAQRRDKHFAELDSISFLTLKKDYEKLHAYTLKLYKKDTSRTDLLLKLGFINFNLGQKTKALHIFNLVKDRCADELETLILTNNEEFLYYSLLGESIIRNNRFDSLLNKYSITQRRSWIAQNIDSIIAKQIYYID